MTDKPVPGKGRENRKREGVEKSWWGRSRGNKAKRHTEGMGEWVETLREMVVYSIITGI